MKHTPEPWELQGGRSFVTRSGEFYLSYGKDCYGNPKFKDFCELDANARLIAAAPELLSALKETLECLTNWMEIQDDEDARDYDEEAVRNAQAAIAKAEGRERV